MVQALDMARAVLVLLCGGGEQGCPRVRSALEDGRFEVREVAGVDRLLADLDASPVDVVVLDLDVVDGSGHEAVHRIRARHEVPVVAVSSGYLEADVVLALEMGADDFVLRSAPTAELAARVGAAARRAHLVEDRDRARIVDGDLEIDIRGREVRLDGRAIRTTAVEFALLAFLASEPRRVFGREELLQRVWGSSAAWQQPSTVTEHVHRLRAKIGSRRIATVRGAGYRYEPAPAAGVG